MTIYFNSFKRIIKKMNLKKCEKYNKQYAISRTGFSQNFTKHLILFMRNFGVPVKVTKVRKFQYHINYNVILYYNEEDLKKLQIWYKLS